MHNILTRCTNIKNKTITIYAADKLSKEVPNSVINLLMPNANYSGRTALLTSKVAFYIVFIQQISVLNILNMVYTLRFCLFKMQFVS